jgi:hypothetical protein
MSLKLKQLILLPGKLLLAPNGLLVTLITRLMIKTSTFLSIITKLILQVSLLKLILKMDKTLLI